MNIKLKLKKNFITKNLYAVLKKRNDARKVKNQFRYNGIFDNRSKGAKILCIVLAGYKEFLYEHVFGRLKRYELENMDFCIISSGKFSQRLKEICNEYGWSYLSTKENNVSLVQNVAIKLHPNAEYIFKLDEDIFITKDYFDKMLRAYTHSEGSFYKTGFLAPVIPLNGFSHLIILERLGLLGDYEEKFERPIIMSGNQRMIQSSSDVAKYFWGDGGKVPSIDMLNDMFSKMPLEECLCPIRFSIGAILFERSFWEQMGYFHVDLSGNAMGMDETQICEYCMRVSRPIVVSKNVVVGHFSFGPQTAEMIKYYDQNRRLFDVQEP